MCCIYVYVYYESIKREKKIRGIYECRCDERLQTKNKEIYAPKQNAPAFLFILFFLRCRAEVKHLFLKRAQSMKTGKGEREETGVKTSGTSTTCQED
jgi:hypothetical protein